jgi:head-tail adaptor|tara:strand:- start:714 stop:1043 length:330 start_codon:yes stop_codon:yes gene_type:complete
MIKAGDLRYRLTVKRNTNSADGYGGFTSSQSTIGTFWCDREFLNGRMIFRDGKRILQTGIELTLRKNTATTNIQRGDILFLTNDSNKYRINEMFEEDLYTFKILADKQQ